MRSNVVRASALMLAAATAVAAAACSEPMEEPMAPEFGLVGHGESGIAFEVYTQNMYLGGETAPLFTLDFTNLPAVISAANLFWAQVLASDAPARASEILEEIGREMPHVVALQEVLQFALLDAAFQPVGGLDLLGEVEDAIGARGLPYETALVQATTSSALPLAYDADAGVVSLWLGFTDRLVTLRRTDIAVVESAQGLYQQGIPLGPFDLRRGWTRLTVDFDGVPHHFVNTHLETQATPQVQALQAAELRAAVLADLEGVTVLAGDLNSNAAASAPDPTWTPTYESLLADGFVDVWATAPHSTNEVGLTCCHDDSLLGDSEFDQRIDFVLVRSTGGGHVEPSHLRGVFRAAIVGEEPSDRTVGGLWPSDHAGLMASLRLGWLVDD